MKVKYTKDIPICPKCQAKTERSPKGTTTTLMGWIPSYDKNEKQIGINPNTVTNYWYCFSCSSNYSVIIAGGKESYGDGDVFTYID